MATNRRRAPQFDLIPSLGLARLADRYALGAAVYGREAWRTGLDPENTLNHIIDHLLKYRDKRAGLIVDDGDDDLAAAAWGCFTLMHYQENPACASSPSPESSSSPDQSLSTKE